MLAVFGGVAGASRAGGARAGVARAGSARGALPPRELAVLPAEGRVLVLPLLLLLLLYIKLTSQSYPAFFI